MTGKIAEFRVLCNGLKYRMLGLLLTQKARWRRVKGIELGAKKY